MVCGAYWCFSINQPPHRAGGHIPELRGRHPSLTYQRAVDLPDEAAPGQVFFSTGSGVPLSDATAGGEIIDSSAKMHA